MKIEERHKTPEYLAKRYAKTNTIMRSLGCEGKDGIYSHEELDQDFDLTAINPDQILVYLFRNAVDLGYKACKKEFREFLGVY